ncbi:hypothetical protein BT96DRAFT_1022490 [Gymnopus androsaceus JB14]|uniref:Uncharacterized protein n=1 Tax=Gymnopus androsaceus JB14 TaxID=1447944 RepID=A0A6A4H9N6_9AGAR|nr:hypothetical protein BT96DRAFT_1022490 [Gymnopus androsaceus JB14]
MSLRIFLQYRNTSFQSIGVQLLFIDSENLDTQKFAPTWNELEQQWTNILWGSRTTASNTLAVAYCTEFVTVIKPFIANLLGPAPPTTSVEVLQQYIAEAQSLETTAQATAESFTLLQGNLTTFVATFQKFATKQQAQDITEIDQFMDIKSLNTQIDTLNNEIAGVGAALGATIFIDVAVLGLFPEAAPLIVGFGVLAVAGEAIAFGILETELNNDYKQMTSDQSQISNLQANLQAISQANSTLASIKNQTATLTTQLGAFDAIWNAVVNDATQVISFLNMASNQTTIPLIFWATINNADCYYQAMATALNNYADGIADSGIPAPTQRCSLEPFVIDHAALHATAMRIISEGKAMAKAMAGKTNIARRLEMFLPFSEA